MQKARRGKLQKRKTMEEVLHENKTLNAWMDTPHTNTTEKKITSIATKLTKGGQREIRAKKPTRKEMKFRSSITRYNKKEHKNRCTGM